MGRLACILLILAPLALAAPACKSNGKTGNGPRPASACDDAREHVQALYREHLAESARPDDDAARARREEQIADDVDMMLADCRADPVRFAPCLRAAVSVAQMQRDCLVPLDDKGEVEGKAFGASR